MPAHSILNSWDHVATNLERIRSEIREAAERAKRDPDAVALVAVTKTMPLEAIEAALDAGQTLFGENRVQEALPKLEALQGRGARFHLIGHLQTNKAKRATGFDMIESVDSVRIATALDRHLDHRLPVLLEVNVSGEPSKEGFAPEALPEALEAIQALPKLQVRGLMTIAPLAGDTEETRPCFRTLRQLSERFELDALSMGMTNDFPIAIAEGATLVRIGRAIFGDR